MRARLNLLPVKTVARRMGKCTNTTCPKFGSQPESLGHVLNACTPNMGLMRARHNTILRRLVQTIPKEGIEIYVEQAISPNGLRPDIVLHDATHRRAVVADVTVSYESGPGALTKARDEKGTKVCRTEGMDVDPRPIPIGLGVCLCRGGVGLGERAANEGTGD